MEGKYKTQEGKEVNIICFDEPNNMAYVDFGDEKKWVAKYEYSTWKPEYFYIPDIPSQMIDNNKIEDDAIQIGEREEVSMDTPPEDSGTMEQRISEPEEPAKEGESSGEKEIKKKRTYKKKKDAANP